MDIIFPDSRYYVDVINVKNAIKNAACRNILCAAFLFRQQDFLQAVFREIGLACGEVGEFLA